MGVTVDKVFLRSGLHAALGHLVDNAFGMFINGSHDAFGEGIPTTDDLLRTGLILAMAGTIAGIVGILLGGRRAREMTVRDLRRDPEYSVQVGPGVVLRLAGFTLLWVGIILIVASAFGDVYF